MKWSTFFKYIFHVTFYGMVFFLGYADTKMGKILATLFGEVTVNALIWSTVLYWIYRLYKRIKRK